jgi:hypothetical protein
MEGPAVNATVDPSAHLRTMWDDVLCSSPDWSSDNVPFGVLAAHGWGQPEIDRVLGFTRTHAQRGGFWTIFATGLTHILDRASDRFGQMAGRLLAAGWTTDEVFAWIEGADSASILSQYTAFERVLGGVGGDSYEPISAHDLILLHQWRTAVPGVLAPLCVAAGIDVLEAGDLYVTGTLTEASIRTLVAVRG